jgi:hypothetical protein
VKKELDDRRRLPRFRITGVGGSITAPVEAEIINLSMGGALVEHQGMLGVGFECILTALVTGAVVGIKCQVAHSTVNHRTTGAAGESLLFYRTGLRFLEISEEAENILATLIRSYGEGGEIG